LPKDKNIVIDGLHFPEDHSFMVETFGPSFQHLHIEASIELRHSRIIDRQIEDIPFQESLNDPIESQINNLKTLSNQIISNNSELTQFYAQIDSVL
jgi:dephospho-CoA kinase